MDGEQKMTITWGLIVEIAANFTQTLFLFGFPYLYLDKPKNKLLRYIPFWTGFTLLFMMCNYFTFHEMTFNHLDTLITVLTLVIYSLVFLKGKLYLRIMIPLIGYTVNLIVALGLLYLMSYLGKMTLAEAVTFSTAFRTLYLVLAHSICVLIYWIILRVGKKKIRLNNPYDIAAFVLMPALLFIGLMSVLLLYEYINFDQGAFIYIVVTFFVFLILALLFWFLLIRAGKANEAKTDLLLSKQREELYITSVLSSNEYIEQLSEVRHDIKNHILTISNLISDGEYEKAQSLCQNITEELSGTAPVHTDNPVLNAIMNVELEKAQSKSISMTYEIEDTLRFVSDADLVSIIGNLCDNAIEYLSVIDVEQRKMSLTISSYLDYRYITCKNTIIRSVLSDNPDMRSTKDDSTLHGKGIKILRSVAESYGGQVLVKENHGELSVSVIILDKNKGRS